MYKYFIGIIFLLNVSFLKADKTKFDSTKLMVGSFSMLNQGVSPFWLRANQHGLLQIKGSQVSAFSEFEAFKQFGKWQRVDVELASFISQSTDLNLKDYFIKYSLGKFGLLVGRNSVSSEFGNDELSTGSFGLSQNALGVTGASFGFMNYVHHPKIKFVKIKGWYKHGVFFDDRYTEKPWLHEKHGSLKFGGKKLAVTGSLYHYALWNGEHPEKGSFPDRWRDYWRVIRGKNADYSYWLSYEFRNEFNALGSHIGVGQLAVSSHLVANKFELLYEKMAEDRSGISKRNQDYRIVCGWDFPIKKYNISIRWETFKTDFQSGAGIPDSNKVFNYGYKYGGRDDYYNNGNYRTGWTHNGSILGTPLFMTSAQAELVFDSTLNSYGRNIVNNRVKGFHWAIKIENDNKFSIILKYTNTLNMGTYTGLNGGRYKWGSKDSTWSDPVYPFNQSLIQSYTCFGFNYIHNNMQIQFRMGTDFGDMYNSFGVYLAYCYRIH